MDYHRKDPRLVEWASRAISIVAGENIDARKKFTEMNGTAIIIMTMSLFPMNENIQQCACYALSRVVSHHPFNRAVSIIVPLDLFAKHTNRHLRSTEIKATGWNPSHTCCYEKL